MKILVINPNTTTSMTDKIAAAAQDIARPDTEIIAANSQEGPASIQGFLDVATCIPGLLAEVSRHPDVDAIVIACFDDTGVDAVRTLVRVPVLGIGEAAYHMASMIANKFSVITTLARSIPGLESNLTRYGLDRKCARVRATDIPVLKLEEGDPATFGLLMRGAVNLQAKIDQMTDRALVVKWPLGRIDPTLRALFRAAGAELTEGETPPKVVINEFVEVARAFFPETKEPKFVNGVLDHMAREARPEAF